MIYVRIIHNISQQPEQDTAEVPEGVTMDGGLDRLWKTLFRLGLAYDKDPKGDHRHQDGGAVFFLRGNWHSLIVMPVGSELHRKHAPPSHYAPGGPLHVPLTNEASP